MPVEELAYHKTRMGELTLRRRTEVRLQNAEVFEIKLGDEYLMSSLFTESERQLASLALTGLEGELNVVVGGLGLGYTAAEVLKNNMVRSLLVIDLFPEIIDWHKDKLVPMGRTLSEDKRCEMRQGDFFDLARTGFDTFDKSREFDAVLLDIDHSPKYFLDENKGPFYGREGLEEFRAQLKAGGAFGLWSNDPVDEEFCEHLESIFGIATAHTIEFANPYTNLTSVNSVYIARNASPLL